MIVKRIFSKYNPLTHFQIVTFGFLLTTSISLSVNAQSKKKDDKEGIKPGKRQAVLILSDGRTIELSAKDSLNYSNNNGVVAPKDSLSFKPQSKPQTNNTNTPEVELDRIVCSKDSKRYLKTKE